MGYVSTILPMKGKWPPGRKSAGRSTGSEGHKQASVQGTSGARQESPGRDGDEVSGRSPGPDGTASNALAKESNPAVWGFVGVVVGSVLTGSLSLVGIKISADNAAEQARTEFLRTQRLAMYASAVSDVQTFIVDADRYGEIAQRLGGTQDAQEVVAALNTAEGSYRKAVTSIWSVRMIAPESLRELNQQVGQLVDCSYYELTNGFQEWDVEYLDETGERINRLVSDFSDHALPEFDQDAPIPVPVAQEQGAC